MLPAVVSGVEKLTLKLPDSEQPAVIILTIIAAIIILAVIVFIIVTPLFVVTLLYSCIWESIRKLLGIYVENVCINYYDDAAR